MCLLAVCAVLIACYFVFNACLFGFLWGAFCGFGGRLLCFCFPAGALGWWVGDFGWCMFGIVLGVCVALCGFLYCGFGFGVDCCILLFCLACVSDLISFDC